MKRIFQAIAIIALVVCFAERSNALTESPQEVMQRIDKNMHRFVVKVYAAEVKEDAEPALSSGSGWLVRTQDGTARIISNAHVVGQATHVYVQFDGEPFAHKVQVLGVDPLVDIALLATPNPLTRFAIPLPLAALPAHVGDPVYAIGYPSGARTISYGLVVSETSALAQSSGFDLFFSHQAPIAPGSSGGALVRYSALTTAYPLALEFVGMNTAVAVSKSENAKTIGNIGYSLHARVVDLLLPKLEAERTVSHARIGWQIADTERVNPYWFELKLKGQYPPEKSGVVVLRIAPDSPAARAGMLAGDTIVKFEVGSEERWVTIPFTHAGELAEVTFFKLAPGTRVRVSTERGTQKLGREMVLEPYVLGK
ncbi:MAG TPA: trypsin-like peptidase domain-containing protein [Candidatus Paceibacterota bacterium]